MNRATFVGEKNLIRSTFFFRVETFVWFARAIHNFLCLFSFDHSEILPLYASNSYWLRTITAEWKVRFRLTFSAVYLADSIWLMTNEIFCFSFLSIHFSHF